MLFHYDKQKKVLNWPVRKLDSVITAYLSGKILSTGLMSFRKSLLKSCCDHHRV